jgi:hypothetical protein
MSAVTRRRIGELAARVTASGGRVPGVARLLRHELADDVVLTVDAAVEADVRARATALLTV